MLDSGSYDRFVEVVDREWTRVFPTLKGEDLPFCLPTASVPKGVSDFTLCSAGGS